ncbi:NAD(P)H-binding protein [Phytoactinopolyspora alkaliphila]|uniref:NAD(P)H-binding protein n=1 Tax=Phytoactinopolyspora alkaliphila TaxID=1783498 RepID=A0A6N9YJH8_9ACTN|nr:NAD(P)H-binding protein [Phytoactinopolyspora alkaliphila]NED95114.1 NAD(P)H-binding protein [Phytoactinopolyspora alkaliphila]
MRITVFGATGNVGHHIVTEALTRGHDVTAVVRDLSRRGSLPPGIRIRSGDATNVDDVAELAAGQDVVVSATRPPAGQEADLVITAKALLAGLAHSPARLMLVGGAASLVVPGTGGRIALDDPRYVFPEYRPIALACAEQLDTLRADPVVDWTYLSPPARLEEGSRTGRFRVGTDELLTDADGESVISVPDLAAALVDEVERPKHRRSRFTAAY